MIVMKINEVELKRIETIIKSNGFAQIKKVGSLKLNSTDILVEKTKTFTGGELLHTIYLAPIRDDIIVFIVVENPKTKCHRLVVSSLTGTTSNSSLRMLVSRIAKATENEIT